DFTLHGDGSVWGIFQPGGSGNTVSLIRLLDGHTINFTGLVTRSGPSGPTFCHVSGDAHFFVISDGKWYTIADDTAAVPGTIKASGAWSGGATDNLPRKNPRAVDFWSDYNQISLADGSTIQTINPANWVSEDSGGHTNLYV